MDPDPPRTVIHGDGETVDAFCDIVVVNYDILDRHVGWLGTHGFRGMVIDEAHFIKNKSSQRSQNVLDLSEQIRERTARPLLMALTGTPLINDIEDFLAIWEFLGWIGGTEPGPALMDALERNGLTPADSGFYPAARTRGHRDGHRAAAQGRRRRGHPGPADRRRAGRARRRPRHVDPRRRARARRRLVKRYESAIAARADGVVPQGIDHALVRQVATWERRDPRRPSSEGTCSP